MSRKLKHAPDQIYEKVLRQSFTRHMNALNAFMSRGVKLAILDLNDIEPIIKKTHGSNE